MSPRHVEIALVVVGALLLAAGVALWVFEPAGRALIVLGVLLLAAGWDRSAVAERR